MRPQSDASPVKIGYVASSSPTSTSHKEGVFDTCPKRLRHEAPTRAVKHVAVARTGVRGAIFRE